MALEPVFFTAFTAVPLLALAIGVIMATAYAVMLEDRRILLVTVLFLLMSIHQVVELWEVLQGASPYGSIVGEIIETSVNLLAVGSIGYVIYTLQSERRLRERLSIVQGTVLGDELDRDEAEDLGVSEPGADDTGPYRPGWFRIPGLGRLLALVFTTLPLGNTAQLQDVLRVAVQNARVTFPIATFDVAEVPPVTVLAEATYLQEVLETVLERMVVYNDSSDPIVTIDLERRTGAVILRITDNGSGLPEDVANRLTGRPGDGPGTDDLELATVPAFIEKWGGDIAVEDGAVELTLLLPQSFSAAVET